MKPPCKFFILWYRLYSSPKQDAPQNEEETYVQACAKEKNLTAWITLAAWQSGQAMPSQSAKTQKFHAEYT